MPSVCTAEPVHRVWHRFGLVVASRRPGVGGLSMDLVQALFDKYDADGSGSISYKEFADGRHPPATATSRQ